MNENKVENPNNKNLAGSLAEDPRFGEIKAELIEGFQKATGKDLLTAEGQDFQFGDPTAFQRGEKPMSLEQKTEKAFQERFPEDAKAYEEMEKVRVYEKPDEDPTIKKFEKEITSKAARENVKSTSFNESLGTQSRVEMREWLNFVRQYPEKAEAYKETFEPIKRAFETQERMRQREKVESKRLEKQRKLEDGYNQLDQQNSVLKRIEEDQKALVEVRNKLGIPIPKNEIEESEGFAKVEKIKEQITKAEREFLDLPENIEDGEDSSIEDFEESEEFLRLQEELKESAEKAMEKFIEDTTNDIIEKNNEFREAENGDKAEKLFRFKFPVYFRENLKNSDSDVTWYTFHFKTLLNSSGRKIYYFEDISIVNRPRGYEGEKTKKPEYNKEELEKNPNFDEDADPELVGKEEKAQIKTLGDLMKKKKDSL
jgi:hypothetical protein